MSFSWNKFTIFLMHNKYLWLKCYEKVKTDVIFELNDLRPFRKIISDFSRVFGPRINRKEIIRLHMMYPSFSNLLSFKSSYSWPQIDIYQATKIFLLNSKCLLLKTNLELFLSDLSFLSSIKAIINNFLLFHVGRANKNSKMTFSFLILHKD